MMQRQDHHQSQQSKAFYDLSSLILNILRSPPSDVTSSPSSSSLSLPRRRRSSLPQQITPAGFASLMLGISLTLMLCGSVTFFIGFMLLPWVIGLVMVFYFVGLVTSLSLLGRTLLYYATASPLPPPSSSPPTPRKDIPAWKFL